MLNVFFVKKQENFRQKAAPPKLPVLTAENKYIEYYTSIQTNKPMRKKRAQVSNFTCAHFLELEEKVLRR